MITVAIVHLRPVVRRAIRSVLDESGSCEVVEESGDEVAEFDLYRRLEPDVLLLDSALPLTPALDIARSIRSESPTTRVILVVTHRLVWSVTELIQAGISGFIRIDDRYETQVLQAVELVAHGGLWFGRVSDGAEGILATNAQLTSREFEVLTLVGKSLSNAQIAERLTISPNTVRNHLSSAYSKLGITSRPEAVLYTVEHGLVNIGDVEIGGNRHVRTRRQ